MKFKSFLLITLTVAAISNVQAAKPEFHIAYTKDWDRNDNGTTDYRTNREVIDFGLGGVTSFGLYFGALYSKESNNTETRTTTSNTESRNPRLSYGPTLGFDSKNFRLMVTYYLKSEYEASSSTNYINGNGLKVDIAYKINIKGWALGPILSYSKFKYEEQDVNGNESALANPQEHGYFVPGVALFLVF